MSGNDQNDDKGFLARWSQRKQEAKQTDREIPAAEADPPLESVTGSEAEPAFDLSSLPKLDDLTGTTDITAFLRKGVPEHLRNAALRKSWALDPAIRNYVNPALDYAYDWNTPGGVPGNSEIEAGTDVARLVSQIMGGGEPATEASPGAGPAASAGGTAQPGEPTATPLSAPDWPTQPLRLDDDPMPMTQVGPNSEQGAPNEADRSADPREAASVAPQQPVRRHGSAKPIV